MGPRLWPSVTTYSSAASPVCACASARRDEEERRACLTGGDEIKSGDFPVDCSFSAAARSSLWWRCHYLIHKGGFCSLTPRLTATCQLLLFTRACILPDLLRLPVNTFCWSKADSVHSSGANRAMGIVRLYILTRNLKGAICKNWPFCCSHTLPISPERLLSVANCNCH